MISTPILDREPLRDLLELLREREWVSDLEEEIMNLWDLCDSKEQRSLLKELVLDTYVLDNKNEKKVCMAINDKIQEWGLIPENTLIIAVADVGKPDGSLVGLQQLKLKIKPTEQWENRYVSHIPEAIGKIKNGDSIVLFDDFIGSGKKMIDKFNWLCNLIKKDLSDVDISSLNFYFLAFAGMKFGIQNIEKTLGKIVFTHISLDKGISDKNNHADADRKIDEMLKLENKLGETYKTRNISEYTLGFNKSEALYFWQNYSCPNNVFPIFWWPTLKNNKRHQTMFVRAN